MLTRARKGFTLLELIVVLVILGLLAAIAIPTYQAVITKAEDNGAVESAKAFARNLQAIGALERESTYSSDSIATALSETDADVAEVDTDATDEVTIGVGGRCVNVDVSGGYSATPALVTDANDDVIVSDC